MINTGPYIEINCGMPLKLVANYHLGRERESHSFRHVLESLGTLIASRQHFPLTFH